MITVDLDMVRRLTREVVNEYGADYTYPSEHMFLEAYCVYVYQSKPSCLVGHVLYRAGVPILYLYSNLVVRDKVEYLQQCDIATITETAEEYLSTLQQVQDRKESWGLAYQAAELVAV